MFKWDSAYRQLEIAEAMYLESEKTKRPTHRLGCCGCSGAPILSYILDLHFVRNAFCGPRAWCESAHDGHVQARQWTPSISTAPRFASWRVRFLRRRAAC